jgi:hypothetical protein
MTAKIGRTQVTSLSMRVEPKFSPVPLAATPQRSVAGGRRFALGGADEARRPTAAAASTPLATLDALLAVQAEGDPAERRRRSLKRGHDLLDALDQLKAALLSGRIGAGQLQRLVSQLAAQRDSSGDPKLDEVVAHIELRAQVELAKLGRA